jgi:hypothetical protein
MPDMAPVFVPFAIFKKQKIKILTRGYRPGPRELALVAILDMARGTPIQR